jgi:anti-sigma-K factor RskA
VTDRIRITTEEVLDTRVDAELAIAARLRSAACAARPESARKRVSNRWFLLLLAAIAMAIVACAVAFIIAALGRSRPRTTPPNGAESILVLLKVAANEQGRKA